ncbi:hypothetical protein CEXT_618051 [Caerostris extrusa]|uniref:Uncharacterized protein n=1 Tax=Caerostris extrusa TaxID=172846 RepID=A0AAV4QX15_CAEEX|nr:hypothetical protein CEXT_618051 [Caerostris extrusa]
MTSYTFLLHPFHPPPPHPLHTPESHRNQPPPYTSDTQRRKTSLAAIKWKSLLFFPPPPSPAAVVGIVHTASACDVTRRLSKSSPHGAVALPDQMDAKHRRVC